MINWTKYFDAIWCISYLPYKSRRESLKNELNRIGILNHPNFNWNLTFSSPWHDYMLENLRRDNKCTLLNVTELKCALGHYECIKKSLLQGHNRILIIEDDSRFLKDLNKIEEILENIPEGYDIMMFDYFVCCDMNEFNSYRKDHMINSHFSEFERLNSTGCYGLSKKAIEIFCNLYEQHIIPSDNYISKIHYDMLKKCFSHKNLSCQATYNKSMSFSNGGNMTIHNVYRKVNLDYSEYMMRDDGSKYTYGDYINEIN